MFKKILIANRGEIALRVICACKELGIRTVAIYSEADRHSLPVRFADEAICIGPPQLALSYLNIPAVISAAEIANVDAMHPGYGLLAENANFAEVCETSGIKFIGPRPEVTRLMGEKEKARAAMKRAGVPILPGSDGILASEGEALEWARQVGFPVIVKASAGGGGRGMRIVRSEEELPGFFKAAQSEAAGAFGNGDLYMEKYVEHPRHIEFQVLADEHGNVVSLGERECSIQRRHQKLLEESPSTQVTPELRDQIGKVLCKSLADIGYTNAGTIEFLMDQDRKLHFIEMNTRIQVEHPVTEMVTDVDLVKSQIMIAAGAHMRDVLQGPIVHRGHAIECRINAEHPEKFTPSAGKITAFHPPGGTGVRVDTAAYAEGVIPPYYDSLIAKLIVRGKDRNEAISRMTRALEMFIVEGVYTTIPLHRKILADPDFRAGKFDTGFIETISGEEQQEGFRAVISLPRLYAIVDAAAFRRNENLTIFATELIFGGCTVLQYRNKNTSAGEMFRQALGLKIMSAVGLGHVKLVMNDRADLCLAAEYDGVHVGQEDLSPPSVRGIIGPDRWLGFSTHNLQQVKEADRTSADYLAIGPVFSTSSKDKPDPVVGLEGVRLARALTRKPLVAIGGITRANAASVIEAGADSVAVISDLLREPRKSAEEFFRILR